jgi:DNA-binding transcriptional regulator LsrR (DeoR family)
LESLVERLYFEFCEAVAPEKRPKVHVYTTCLVGRGMLPEKASHVDPIVNATLLWAKCGRVSGRCHYATVPPYRTATRTAIKDELKELAQRRAIHEAVMEMDKIEIAFAGLGAVKPELPQDDPEKLHSKITMTSLLEPIITPDELRAEGAIAEISNSFFGKDGKGDDEHWQFFLSAGYYDGRRRGVEFFRRMVDDGKTVIVMAGPHKTEAIRVALKARLFNVWITDYQTLCTIAEPPSAKI